MTLVVTRVVGLSTVQDLGRRGHMHEALPPGGALVPELLVIANRRAGNLDGAPALEVLGQLVVRAELPIAFATDRTATRTLHVGETVALASELSRCTYLAIAGGVAAPRVLDGCGTLLSAGLGAPLRVGDVLRPGDSRARSMPIESFMPSDVVHVLAGPDLEAFAPHALDMLVQTPYRISSSSNRVGTRLAGPAVPRLASYREQSRPMVRGAIEVPRDGQPIVLGPEHPTTGGYPVLAVIANAELGRFHAIRLGGSVQFALVR